MMKFSVAMYARSNVAKIQKKAPQLLKKNINIKSKKPTNTKNHAATTRSKKAQLTLAFQAQQAKTAALIESFHETTAFDDVAARAYAPAPTPTEQQMQMLDDTTPIIPETADPMVALVAASVDMQQRQVDQMRAAAETQSNQHAETIRSMTDALDLSRQSQRNSLETVRRELNSHKQAELQSLRVFGEQQRKHLRTTLDNHTSAEKKRLDQFRAEAEKANKKKLSAQEQRFSRSAGRVTETLTQHADGMQRLLSGLRKQQDVTRGLKESIECKAAAALASKNSNQTATVSAIQAVGAALKREQAKGASSVVSAVENKNRHQEKALKTTLSCHQAAQQNLIKNSFKTHQQSQLKGLATALATQKAQQSSQLSTLREALAARRRLTGQNPMSTPVATLPASSSRFFGN